MNTMHQLRNEVLFIQRNYAYEKKKRIILKKIQLVLAQTQVPPIFPFSPKNSHFQKSNFEK